MKQQEKKHDFTIVSLNNVSDVMQKGITVIASDQCQ